jgi:peroxiredoxin family protein
LNLAYIIATVTFNIVHAPNNLLAQALAALPPVTLFFTFEVLMAMIEHNLKERQGIAAMAAHQAALVEAQSGFSEIMTQVEAIKAQHNNELAERDSQLLELNKRLDIALDPVGYRRNAILEDQNSPTPSTQKALAERYNVTTQTIQNDLRTFNGSIVR